MSRSLIFVTLTTLLMGFAASERIQIQQTPGIIVPAQSIRMGRASYGGSSNSGSSGSYDSPAPSSYSAPASQSSYASSTPVQIPAPPCPRNYMFGCEPSLTPVPCSQPAQSYSAPAQSYQSPQGSYSHYFPQYAVPVVREVY